MSNILFLVPYPINEAPSQRFRFEQYFNALLANKHTFTVQSFISISTWKILYKPGYTLKKVIGILAGFLRRFAILFQLWKYDFVFIHREASPLGPPIFEWLICKLFKKKVIFDFDDAIWLPNTSGENKIVASIKWHSKTALICKWAYKCSCGNAFLANYAKQFNPNVVINPTTIDLENYHSGKKDQSTTPIKIGWTGTHTTLKYLNDIIPALQSVQSKINFSLVIISNKDPELSLQNVEFIPWKKETEINDLLRFHIGIMPLTDDDWSRGKCGFKALQYMSLGIPAIVAPVGVNTQIVDHEQNGFLCSTNQEWENALMQLLSNPNLRIAFGEKAQQKIRTHFSVKANTPNFLQLFK